MVRDCFCSGVCWVCGWGICTLSPLSCSIATTIMKTTISVSSTSMSGVTLICGPDGPPPAIENAMEIAPLGHACLQHQTPVGRLQFPREAENPTWLKGSGLATAWLRRNTLALTDWLRGGWQGRHFRRIRRSRRNLRRGLGRIHYRAERGIAAGKEINRIRRKEYDGRHGNQRDHIKEESQHNTSGYHGQGNGLNVPGEACRLARHNCGQAKRSHRNTYHHEQNYGCDANHDCGPNCHHNLHADVTGIAALFRLHHGPKPSPSLNRIDILKCNLRHHEILGQDINHCRGENE